MQIRSSWATDVGRKRKVNEDSVSANNGLGLFVVCDGMGGHSCGDMASQTAIEVINGSVSGANGKNKESVLKEAIELANQGIWEISTGRVECKGMGTTVASLLVDEKNKRIITGHAGDSRVYRLRGGELTRLTTDHSLVEEQLALGLISKEEAEVSTQKNVITRALGQRETVQVSLANFDIEDGDLVLICSDGLNNMITDTDIKGIITGDLQDLDKTVMKLVESANENGGTDNISVVLASFSL